MRGRPRGAGARGARRAETRGRRRGYHHGDLRRALLDAALHLVETEGADALTLRGAARLAGVSQAAPYRHFADKQALLAGVAEEGFRALAEGMRQAMDAAGGDALGRFRALGLAYVAFATSHPAHFRVMFGRQVADASRHPTLATAAQAAFGLLVEALARCQQAGLAQPGDPKVLALPAWAIVHGLSALMVEGHLPGRESPADAQELAHAVTAAVFLGLGTRPG